ncbi:MAG: NYN domain-containing protein [Acidobacteria bacterium]|nr:NYN domain-containing protein [Acidobacteriota bacterium]
MPSNLRTTLYVDGFNLYYGAAKNTRLKWVNVIVLAETVLPGLRVNRTRYFTAMVKSTPTDPQQAQRQQTYIRALESLPNLTVHYGHYQATKIRAKACNPPPDSVLVHKTEEKGTDVNLATYILADAFRDECDQLVVITNDSDLAEPIRIVNSELKRRVIVLNPHSTDTASRKNARNGGNHKSHPSYHLSQVAFAVKDIRSHGNNCHMTQAQFPHSITDGTGTITIPSAWL